MSLQHVLHLGVDEGQLDAQVSLRAEQLGQLVRVLSPQATDSHRVRMISSELRSALLPENVETDLDLSVPHRSGGSSHLDHLHHQLLLQL